MVLIGLELRGYRQVKVRRGGGGDVDCLRPGRSVHCGQFGDGGFEAMPVGCWPEASPMGMIPMPMGMGECWGGSMPAGMMGRGGANPHGAGSARCGAAGRDRIARRARVGTGHRGGDVVEIHSLGARDCQQKMSAAVALAKETKSLGVAQSLAMQAGK